MTSSIEKNDTLKKGDVVWAKVKGHPWWPGQIRRINIKHSKTDQQDKQTIYRINFIGENTHVDLPQAKVENFEAKYDKYSQIKKKTLQRAIDKAKRMLREKELLMNNRNVSSQNSSRDESETQSIVVDNDEDADDSILKTNKNKQCNETKRFSKSKISFMNQLKENKNADKRNNTNINANLNSNSHINSNNHGDASSLCGLNRNPNNINISININVTNNNHNTVNISSFENNRPTTEPMSNINPTHTSKSQSVASQHEESESYTEENFEDMMKFLVENLLQYQIEVSNTSSQKFIINILDKIKDLLSNETFPNLYELTKDIIPITHTFTYHKNHDIKMRSTVLLSLITSAIISEVFNLPSPNIIPSSEFVYAYNENDINDNFKQSLMSVINDSKKRNNIYAIPTNEIITALMYSKNQDVNTIEATQHKGDNITFLGKKNKRQKSNNTQSNTNQIENDFHLLCSKKEGVNNFNHNIDVDDKDFKFIYEDFLKVLNNNNAVNTFDSISSDFYKNTYNKFNELDIVSSKKRKQVCLKLLSLLKKILIGVDIESLKKMIIFFEYQVRNEDPTFGKKYIQHIGSFYIKMKEIINEKDKDINDP